MAEKVVVDAGKLLAFVEHELRLSFAVQIAPRHFFGSCGIRRELTVQIKLSTEGQVNYFWSRVTVSACWHQFPSLALRRRGNGMFARALWLG